MISYILILIRLIQKLNIYVFISFCMVGVEITSEKEAPNCPKCNKVCEFAEVNFKFHQFAWLYVICKDCGEFESYDESEPRVWTILP